MGLTLLVYCCAPQFRCECVNKMDYRPCTKWTHGQLIYVRLLFAVCSRIWAEYLRSKQNSIRHKIAYANKCSFVFLWIDMWHQYKKNHHWILLIMVRERVLWWTNQNTLGLWLAKLNVYFKCFTDAKNPTDATNVLLLLTFFFKTSKLELEHYAFSFEINMS